MEILQKIVDVKICSSEVLLHWRCPACGSDRAHFLPSDFIICFYKVDEFMMLWVTLVT
jgi:hypothetical protein